MPTSCGIDYSLSMQQSFSYVTLIMFTVGISYSPVSCVSKPVSGFALCAYSGVMYDAETILQHLAMWHRGETLVQIEKGQPVEGNGDCIDCNQCVAVCPTASNSSCASEGCITCALCLDALRFGHDKSIVRTV